MAVKLAVKNSAQERIRFPIWRRSYRYRGFESLSLGTRVLDVLKSALAGFAGFVAISFIFGTDPHHHWDGSPLIIGDYTAETESLFHRFVLTLLFIGVPVFLTLPGNRLSLGAGSI